MKYLRQLMVILLFSMIGELLHALLPLPVPASVYGLVLLFAALMSKLVRPDDIRETAGFLIQIMPVMFIPAGAGLITSWGALEPMLFPIVLITVVSLVFVMIVTGHAAQFVIRRRERRCRK